MAKKHIPQHTTGWHEFGQFIAIIAGIAASMGCLYLLLLAPYQRHQEVIGKLDTIRDMGYTQMRVYTYGEQEKK